MFFPKITFLKHVTVEPAICLFFVASAISQLCGQNLLLQKSCHPTAYLGASSRCDDEDNAQKRVTFINTWYRLAYFCIPVVFVMFAGAWSDNAGKRRRPLMILPIAGQIFADLLCIVNVYFWYWSPIVAALAESLVAGLTGSRPCVILGASCYIADVTSNENRTFRLGMIIALLFICTPLGSAAGGVLYFKFDFYWVYLTTAAMNAVAILCVLLFVKNRQTDAERIKTEKGFFDLDQFLQSLVTIAKNRDGHKRKVLLLVTVALSFTEISLLGEYSVLYLFVRYMFQWDLQIYGLYAAYKMAIILIGTVVALGLLSRVFRLSDATIGIIAAVTQILSNVGNAFAVHPYEMYIYPIVDFMHGSSMAVSFSIASKTVDPSEVGRVNGAISAFKALVPLVVVPTYNFVYNKTLDIFPGSFFLLSASIGTVLLVIFSALYILQNIDQSKEPIVEECTRL